MFCHPCVLWSIHYLSEPSFTKRIAAALQIVFTLNLEMVPVELQRMITAAGGIASDDPAQVQDGVPNMQHDLTEDILSMVYGNVEPRKLLPGEQTQFEILKEKSTGFLLSEASWFPNGPCTVGCHINELLGYGTPQLNSRITSHLKLRSVGHEPHMLLW